jgi:hypothetical protein
MTAPSGMVMTTPIVMVMEGILRHWRSTSTTRATTTQSVTLIVVHGSRGKPKTVRLVLTETAITWRTEMRKKNVQGGKELKLGKLHQVPLSHIMCVDIGKQTTALHRVENAAVSEALCFSLLTKECSLDLEANSPRERDALVQCFSLVLDEMHAQNRRSARELPTPPVPLEVPAPLVPLELPTSPLPMETSLEVFPPPVPQPRSKW